MKLWPHTHHRATRIALPVLGVIVALALILGVLEVTDTTHFFHKTQPPVSRITAHTDTMGSNTGNNQKGEPSGSTTSSNTAEPSTSTEQEDNKSDSGGGNNQVLLAPDPSNGFVSNHHPNLSGHPAPATLTSVCTTTPGARCTITFTKDGVTKSLPTQTTDRGGSAYWNDWSLQSIGLTAGSWQIKAVATLGSQTEAATDSMDLVVSP